MKLTPKEAHFVEVYLETGNASEAYRTAYDVGENTKQSTIKVKASQLLKKNNINITVSNKRKELAKASQITREDLIDMYMGIIATHGQCKEYFKGNTITPANLKKIYAMSNSGYIKGADVTAAIKGVERLLGFDKPEVNTKVVQNIQINIKHNRDD